MEFERLDVGRRVLFLTDEQRVALANGQEVDGWISDVYQKPLASARLETMPGEILKRIFEHLAKDPEHRWELPSTRILYKTSAETLRNLTHVSKTIGPWAQEVLHAWPVLLSQMSSDMGPRTVECPITLLVRTLLEKPQLGRQMQRLTVFLPQKRSNGLNIKASELADNDLQPHQPAIDVIGQARAFVKTLPLRASIRRSWANKMVSEYPYPLLGVLLALAPNLKELGIIMGETRAKDGTVSFLSESFGMKAGARNLAQIRVAGILGSLESLKVCGLYPLSMVGLDIFPQIQELVMRTTFNPRRSTSFSRVTVADGQFKFITRLHLDLQIPSNSTVRSRPIHHYGPLLAKFPNLMHLDLDDNPRVSYSEDNPYSMLIGDLLSHLPNPEKLLSLRLSDVPAAYPSFSRVMGRFENLEQLTTPYSEIKASGGYIGYVFNMLPQTLRHLEVYEADLGTVICLQRLVAAKLHRGFWPLLTWAKINFGGLVSDESFEDLEGRVMYPYLWTNAEKAGVEIVVDKW